MPRCEQCGLKVRDGGLTTVTGRQLCSTCGDVVTGTTLGMMQGDVGTAIALGYSKEPGVGSGILAWVRKALKGR